MRCPKCHKDEDKVIDSRISRDGSAIRRRRECLPCGHRFTTYETIEPVDFVVIKRNGCREPFDRDKLLRGMSKACEKRPVARDELENAADAIIAALESDGTREIPAKLLGIKVMDK